MFKLSQYTVINNLEDRNLPDYNLIFNTESSKSFIVKKSNWDLILKNSKNMSKQTPQLKKAITELVLKGILVNNSYNEKTEYEKKFDATRYKPRKIYPLIAVTSACNIGCTYCYEEGIRSKTMSFDIASKVLNWMEKRIIEDDIKEINPGLFGGEPLLYPKLLFFIMDGFNTLKEKYKIKGSFYTSSNGMYMTKELSQELGKRGLVQIQISLDGPEIIHDVRRIGKSGEASFHKSLIGIKNAIPYIKNVTVKVNFDRHNRKYIKDLYDFILYEKLENKVDVKLETIAMQMSDSKVSHKKEYVIPPESKELADAYIELILEAQNRGIKVSRDTAHTTPCMFSSHHGVLIDPFGDIYKCISLVGRNEFKVGSILNDYYNADEYNKQMNTLKKLDECFEEKCQYIPVCAGGCSYESIVRTGRYDLRFCTKENLKNYHYKLNLIKYEKELCKLGMKALTPNELKECLVDTNVKSTNVCSGCSSCN